MYNLPFVDRCHHGEGVYVLSKSPSRVLLANRFEGRGQRKGNPKAPCDRSNEIVRIREAFMGHLIRARLDSESV